MKFSRKKRSENTSARAASRGFTLIEMIIVLSIISIFMSIAIPMFSRSLLTARERALRSDLQQLRDAIWKYTFDKQKGPQSLDDLKTAGYIFKIPDDPITHEPNWAPEQEDVILFIDQQDSGIIDVHSASDAMATDGTAYSSW